MELNRDNDGKLSSYAFPGGYTLYYITRDSMAVCPDCANRETDQSQAPVACDANWEDDNLYCEDCGERIESAYGDND